MQLTFVSLRTAKFRYLLKHDPKRIVTDAGPTKFMNFNWSKNDNGAFLKNDKYNRSLISQIARLKEKIDGHPDWSNMRSFVRAELAASPEFKKITNEFSKRQDELKTLISKCAR